MDLTARNELKGLFAIIDGVERGSKTSLSSGDDDPSPMFGKRAFRWVVGSKRNVITDFHLSLPPRPAPACALNTGNRPHVNNSMKDHQSLLRRGERS